MFNWKKFFKQDEENCMLGKEDDVQRFRIQMIKTSLEVDNAIAPSLQRLGICSGHMREIFAEAKLEAIAMREVETLIELGDFSDENWRKALEEKKLSLEAQWNNVLESRIQYDKRTGRSSFRR